jgi:hypothetical protein
MSPRRRGLAIAVIAPAGGGLVSLQPAGVIQADPDPALTPAAIAAAASSACHAKPSSVSRRARRVSRRLSSWSPRPEIVTGNVGNDIPVAMPRTVPMGARPGWRPIDIGEPAHDGTRSLRAARRRNTSWPRDPIAHPARCRERGAWPRDARAASRAGLAPRSPPAGEPRHAAGSAYTGSRQCAGRFSHERVAWPVAGVRHCISRRAAAPGRSNQRRAEARRYQRWMILPRARSMPRRS